MIIENKIKEQAIVAFKLITGEEIIARITTINTDNFVVYKPMMITLVHAEGGAQVAFVPWTLGMKDDAKITLLKSQIVAYSDARKEANAGYIKNTTGLEMATGSGLVT